MAQFSVKIMRLTGSLLGEKQHSTRKAIGISRATSAAQPAQEIAKIEAEDLAYTLREGRDNDDTARLSDAIYETFRLQAIAIPGAEPHPTKLVQSAAMASVMPPKPSYRPKLRKRCIYPMFQ
jgi:hypothetical protein